MQYYYHYKAVNTFCKNRTQLVAYELVTEKEAIARGILADCKEHCQLTERSSRDTFINFGVWFKST